MGGGRRVRELLVGVYEALMAFAWLVRGKIGWIFILKESTESAMAAPTTRSSYTTLPSLLLQTKPHPS